MSSIIAHAEYANYADVITNLLKQFDTIAAWQQNTDIAVNSQASQYQQ